MARIRTKQSLKLKAGEISPKYCSFFRIEMRRSTTTNRHVAIVIPELFSEFLKTVKTDEAMPLEMKALIAILLSGGLRITEALMLQRSDFEMGPGSRVEFYSRVLKKRNLKTERKSVIHQEIQSIVSEHLLRKRGFEHLFKLSRKAALHQIKKYLGESVDLHALRHSCFSYLLFLKELPLLEVSKFVEVSPSTMLRYAHLNKSEILRTLFQEKKSA